MKKMLNKICCFHERLAITPPQEHGNFIFDITIDIKYMVNTNNKTDEAYKPTNLRLGINNRNTINNSVNGNAHDIRIANGLIMGKIDS